jgi:hypothetical protein
MKTNLRKVDKTIVLQIYYYLYHNENWTVNTLLYAQFSVQNYFIAKYYYGYVNLATKN